MFCAAFLFIYAFIYILLWVDCCMFRFKLTDLKLAKNAHVHKEIEKKMHITRTTSTNGRLGNQIIRNLAISFIAKKHDLKIEYCNKALIESLGINLFSGTHFHHDIMKLTDDNYFNVYNSTNLNFALDPNSNFFQTKEITNFIYKYLQTEDVKCNIIDKNPFKIRYNANNDLFIHIRLTDVANKNPGINYYLNAIKNIKYDELYISTDDKKHAIVLNLLKLFPNAKLVQTNEIATFQFASTCKHVVLSHGSFSAVIGYLSFFSDVYYPEYDLKNLWYGDMFSIDGWNKRSVV